VPARPGAGGTAVRPPPADRTGYDAPALCPVHGIRSTGLIASGLRHRRPGPGPASRGRIRRTGTSGTPRMRHGGNLRPSGREGCQGM